MEVEYLMSSSEKNMNYCLLEAIKNEGELDEKVITEILKYFTKLTKHYYSSIFYEVVADESIWKVCEKNFGKKYLRHFGSFIEEIFKSHFDQLALFKNNSFSTSRVAI